MYLLILPDNWCHTEAYLIDKDEYTYIPKTQLWAYYKVNFHSLFGEARKRLDVPERYQAEENPHITIHPGFQFERGEEKKFRSIVYDTFPKRASLTVDGFHYHPEDTKPWVICFSVDMKLPFSKLQNDLVRKISRNGGKSVTSPAPPHITIYKDSTSGHKFVPSNIDDIQRTCSDIGRKLPVEISSTELQIERANTVN